MMPDPAVVLSVSAYTRRVKSLLEQRIHTSWLRGEISNLRIQSSGHVYFSLKDENSQLPCVMFRGSAAGLDFRPEDGMQVLVEGDISVYEPAGRYQLIAREMLRDGVGRLQMEFERLKRKLQAEGLFDPERKKAIPALPRKVGFVTSPTGAALRDFISILRRRGWNGEIVVFPTKVQGEGAAQEIVKMIGLAGRTAGLELLVVGRGGGSLEDLWSFNEEAVARAVAVCSIPTISAVGHEIDFALTDFVADKRAETPSAAAELISSRYVEMEDLVNRLSRQLDDEVDYRLERLRSRLERYEQDLRRMDPVLKIERLGLRLDELEQKMGSVLKERLSELRHRLQDTRFALARYNPEGELRLHGSRLADVARRLERLTGERLRQDRRELEGLAARLESASPQSILKRGFTFFTDRKGKAITSVGEVHPMQQGALHFSDGVAEVAVEYIRTKKGKS